MSDMINSPKHYKLPGLDIESIHVIKAVTRQVTDPWRAFLRGNELKYLIRADQKNGIEDLRKARKYLDWEIEAWEEANENRTES